MNRKKVNEEQFRKLVLKEAKEIFSENSERRVTIDNVESLISEMKETNKSISSIDFLSDSSKINEKKECVVCPNRDLDVIEHNKKKNVIHVNESEKDKWNRMLKYKVPSDEER